MAGTNLWQDSVQQFKKTPPITKSAFKEKVPPKDPSQKGASGKKWPK
jgi:hypothetical protein